MRATNSIEDTQLAVSDQFLAYLELRKDTFFHKIPSEKIHYYLDEALAYGRKLAEEYDLIDSTELCRCLDVTVEMVTDNKQRNTRGTLELTNNRKIIRIYRHSLMEIVREHSVSLELLEEAVLSHELFHLLEEQTQSTAERLEQVNTMHFLGFKRRARIRQTREIAAHAFVKKRMKLPYLPNYWDYSWDEAMSSEDLLVIEKDFCSVMKKSDADNQ